MTQKRSMKQELYWGNYVPHLHEWIHLITTLHHQVDLVHSIWTHARFWWDIEDAASVATRIEKRTWNRWSGNSGAVSVNGQLCKTAVPRKVMLTLFVPISLYLAYWARFFGLAAIGHKFSSRSKWSNSPQLATSLSFPQLKCWLSSFKSAFSRLQLFVAMSYFFQQKEFNSKTNVLYTKNTKNLAQKPLHLLTSDLNILKSLKHS